MAEIDRKTNYNNCFNYDYVRFLFRSFIPLIDTISIIFDMARMVK